MNEWWLRVDLSAKIRDCILIEGGKTRQDMAEMIGRIINDLIQRVDIY